MTAFATAQYRYDTMIQDLGDIEERAAFAADVAAHYGDRDEWLEDHGLDLDDNLIRVWADAQNAGIQVDGSRLRTLYRRSCRWLTMADAVFGVRS